MDRQKLEDSLIVHEGIRNLPYEDSVGVLTIGVGHNLGKPISKAAIKQILNDDIDECLSELDRVFTTWRCHPDNVQRVMVEMMFNLGAPRFQKFRKMLQALHEKDYQTASKEMLDSKWAKQVGQRAKTLSEMITE